MLRLPTTTTTTTTTPPLSQNLRQFAHIPP
jgi:hypothetical protein